MQKINKGTFAIFNGMKFARLCAVGCLVAVFAAAIFWFGLFRDPENFFQDLLFSERPVRSDVVVVAIDEKSLKIFGQWPWPRAVYARLIARLGKYPPAALGLDVNFPEVSRLGATDDAALAQALRGALFPVVLPLEATPLVLPWSGGPPQAPQVTAPIEAFRGGERVQAGFVNLITDRDGVVRRMPLLVRGETETITPAFAALVAGVAPQEPIRRIVFTGPPGTIPRVSFADVMNDDALAASLRGKRVFVGVTIADLHDEQLTPFSQGLPMSGVEIQAQAAAMLLQNWRLDALPRGVIAFWVFAAALLAFALVSFVPGSRLGLAFASASGIVHLPAAVLLFENGLVGNILHVNFAWTFGAAVALALRHFVTEREKRELRHVFSKYVSRDVMNEILRDATKVRLGGEEAEATVFFSDVRDFTTLSERLTPTELTHFLNRYFTVMTNITLDRRGVVDKYIGDALMAFWGAPLKNPGHATDAVLAALDMIDALAKFNAENAASGGLAIDIGIGLSSGSVVAGNMGSDQRLDYTVMGDTVNLASRLEGQTKTYGVHIVTSEFTVAKLPEEFLRANNIVVREIDRARVKGKNLPVTIFEVVERSRQAAVREIAADFDRLRIEYYAGRWAECLTIGRMILARGDDGPTRVLVERVKYFLTDPPANWKGVYDFKTK